MVSAEIKREGKTIEIECDQNGLELLIQPLEKLRNMSTHVHLLAAHHLGETTPWGKTAVPEIIISTGGN